MLDGFLFALHMCAALSSGPWLQPFEDLDGDTAIVESAADDALLVFVGGVVPHFNHFKFVHHGALPVVCSM